VPYPDIAPDIASHHPHSVSKTCIIKVITPIFGGGAEAGVNDPVTLIRPSSIRGHLRFWWRATRGAQFNSVEALRQREGEIWGTTKNPSPVNIAVKPVKRRDKRRPDNYYGFDQYGPEAYVLFSAKQNENELCKEGVMFSLELWWLTHERLQELRRKENEERLKARQPPLPDVEDIGPDIEAAVWAWVNFGGIGARTRRGFGALFCEDFAPFSADGIGEWFKSGCKEYGLDGTIPLVEWPLLTKPPLIRSGASTPLEAWSQAVSLMRDFRQGSVGRNGRSLWPEADSLRAITGEGQYRDSVTLPGPINSESDTAFPRAELGLPIVFHFKDNADSPNNCELYPKDKTRMASHFTSLGHR
jgi:CRISPR-associated protein Cmr1